MDRLTQWIDENRAIPRVDLRRCGHERCTTQLARYEDTGLDPEQIQGLKDRDTAKPLIERHYEEPGEEPYIKYTCPNGCNIQPSRRSQFCSLCGQRLDWSGENDAVQ